MSDLLAAYRRTRYTVLASDGSIVAAARIGEASADVDAVLADHGATTGVFVTAWNPRSEPHDDTVNDAAQARLEAELSASGVMTLPHAGIGDDPAWAPEQGVLALDLPEADAVRIATAYGQNAVVLVERGRPARLVTGPLMG
jgi:hypothetical protein